MKLPGQGAGPDIMNQVGPQEVKTGIGFGDVLGAVAAGGKTYMQAGGDFNSSTKGYDK